MAAVVALGTADRCHDVVALLVPGIGQRGALGVLTGQWVGQFRVIDVQTAYLTVHSTVVGVDEEVMGNPGARVRVAVTDGHGHASQFG